MITIDIIIVIMVIIIVSSSSSIHPYMIVVVIIIMRRPGRGGRLVRRAGCLAPREALYIIHKDIVYTYIHTHIHTYIHTCIRTYMHACMHAYIRTCIQHTYHTSNSASTIHNTYTLSLYHTSRLQGLVAGGDGSLAAAAEQASRGI